MITLEAALRSLEDSANDYLNLAMGETDKVKASEYIGCAKGFRLAAQKMRLLLED